MSSEADLNASIEEYTIQLQHVNHAIDSSSSADAERESLCQLRGDLQELLQLTRDSLAAVTSTTKTTAGAADPLDDEFTQFMREIRAVDELQAAAQQQTNADAADDGDDADDANSPHQQSLDHIRATLSARLGTKCTAPHTHAWGARAQHNAMISALVDPESPDDDDDDDTDDHPPPSPTGIADVRVRVMFTHPTHREMLPCTHYLDGECRYADAECRYSHGELVRWSELGDYRQPDYAVLQRRRRWPVLVRRPDGLWHRAHTVRRADGRTCHLRLERGGGGSATATATQTELADVDYADVWPLHADDDSSDNDSVDDDDDSEADGDSNGASRDEQTTAAPGDAPASSSAYVDARTHAALVERSLLQPAADRPLGEWERHTRGFGSRMLQKYGYVIGTGLGRGGEGRVVPVGAQQLPAGRSLDYCMALREQAHGDRNLFSVERRVRRQQQLQERREQRTEAKREAAAAEAAAASSDVFSFMNDRLLAGVGQLPAKQQSSAAATAATAKAAGGGSSAASYTGDSTKTLNVAGFQLGEEIRRKEADARRTEASLRRHAAGTPVHGRLRAQLDEVERELAALRRSEVAVRREQTARKDKAKLSVF